VPRTLTIFILGVNMELSLFLRLNIPDHCRSDERYDDTIKLISEKLEELAKELEGSVIDIEF
jgi:hypothetical protein